MKYGLILCSRTLNNGAEISNVFFTSIAQLNLAGPDAVPNPSQKIVIAGLNLKAGRLSNTLSDYMSALKFFEHGILYLGEDRWAAQYELSLGLYNAAAETAGSLANIESVKSYTDELVENAHSFDDSLHCTF